MNSDWKFDNKELYHAYKSKNITLEDKLKILELLYLNRGQKKTLYKKNICKFRNIEQAKQIFLAKMKKDYFILGEDFIRNIIDLEESKVFECYYEEPIYKNSMNKISDITLDIYSRYSNVFYKIAKDAIINKSILVASNLRTRSFMTHIDSINKSYCVVDKSDSPDTFIHETEHLIEKKLEYKTPELYDELGSTTFETLFIDELVDRKINGSNLLYFNRVRRIYSYLQDLSNYYKSILYAKKFNFNLSNSQFVSMMSEIMNIRKWDIIDSLSEEYNNDTYVEELTYIVSFIKSIDIRNKMLNDKKLGFKELKKCLNAPDISFNEKKYCESIKSYVKEINKKNKNN